MFKSEHLIYGCGILSIVLLSVTFITLTGKLIIKMDKNKPETTKNHIYDPDYRSNFTGICLLSDEAYSVPYEKSPCQNRTMNQWYLPWVRDALWRQFWRKGEEKRRMRREEEAMKRMAVDDSADRNVSSSQLPARIAANKTDKPRRDLLKEKPSEVLYAVLVGLVVISALGACWEAFRNKFKKDEGTENGGGGGGGSGGGPGSRGSMKNCSLAEFTINRHLRRESQLQQQQQYQGNSQLSRQASVDIPAKVTQTLIHQSSLDRALPKSVSGVNFREGRRNSMPIFPIGFQVGGGKPSTSIRGFQRQNSMDVPSEENILDARKKPRFFIRRH